MYSTVIYLTFGIVAFIGILLPIFISFIQNKQLKADHKALTDKIAIEMQAAKAALITEIKCDLEKEIKKFKTKNS